MPVTRHRSLLPALALLFGTGACDPGVDPPEADDEPPVDEPDDIAPRCGPARGVVDQVIDGDTIILESGEKIRYLMVNTPEITNGKNECYGAEAREYNMEIVHGREVELAYDAECADQFGRLLAYVTAPDGEINSLLVARGFACVLQIPPNGEAREIEFNSMERAAREQNLGLWGACGANLCN